MNFSEAIKLARKNDEKGYIYLYEQTFPKAFYVALKYTKQEECAYDVLQDAYIKAFTNLNQLNDSEKFIPWFHMIVSRTALNELKKRTPLLFSQLDSEDEAFDVSNYFQDENIDTQPELAMDQKETSRLIKEIIDTLSDEQRVCVTMYYIQELSVKEIAETLQVSENTVKSRLHYSRKKIEEQVRLLEKKGTKLYSFAPLSFFILLLKTDIAVKASEYIPLQNYKETMEMYRSEINCDKGGVMGKVSLQGGTLGVKVGIAVVATASLVVAGILVYSHSINSHNDASSFSTEGNDERATEILFEDSTESESAEIIEEGSENDYLENTEKENGSDVSSSESSQKEEMVNVSETIDLRAKYEEYISSCVLLSGYEYGVYIEVDDSNEGYPVSTGDNFFNGTVTYYIDDFDGDAQEELVTITSCADGSLLLSYLKYDQESNKVVQVDTKNYEGVKTDANEYRAHWSILKGDRTYLLYDYYYGYSIFCDGYYRGFSYVQFSSEAIEEVAQYFMAGSSWGELLPEYDNEIAKVLQSKGQGVNDDILYDIEYNVNFMTYLDGILIGEIGTTEDISWQESSIWLEGANQYAGGQVTPDGWQKRIRVATGRIK